jgi:hypothetical protein
LDEVVKLVTEFTDNGAVAVPDVKNLKALLRRKPAEPFKYRFGLDDIRIVLYGGEAAVMTVNKNGVVDHMELEAYVRLNGAAAEAKFNTIFASAEPPAAGAKGAAPGAKGKAGKAGGGGKGKGAKGKGGARSDSPARPAKKGGAAAKGKGGARSDSPARPAKKGGAAGKK